MKINVIVILYVILLSVISASKVLDVLNLEKQYKELQDINNTMVLQCTYSNTECD